MPDRRTLRTCVTSPADRIVRGVAALLVGAFALSVAGQPWCAVPAGIWSLLLAVGAITGWCPTDLLRARESEAIERNTLGYPEARRHVDLS